MLESVQKLVLVWLTIFSLVYSLWKYCHSSSSCNNYQLRRYINTCSRRKLLSSLSLLSSSSSSSLTLSSNPASTTIDWKNHKQPENLEFPTDEQKNVMDAAFAKNRNIVVNAVAGSGKTTTISNIANACKDQSILTLTYNKQLKDETKKKCDINLQENIDVYNFHSFVFHKYSECGKDDKGMEEVIRTAKQPTEPFSYDIIIIDEIQDMKLSFYKLIFKILKDNLQKDFRIIVLGSYHHHHHRHYHHRRHHHHRHHHHQFHDHHNH